MSDEHVHDKNEDKALVPAKRADDDMYAHMFRDAAVAPDMTAENFNALMDKVRGENTRFTDVLDGPPGVLDSINADRGPSIQLGRRTHFTDVMERLTEVLKNLKAARPNGVVKGPLFTESVDSSHEESHIDQPEEQEYPRDMFMRVTDVMVNNQALASDGLSHMNIEDIAPVVRQVLASVSSDLAERIGLDTDRSDEDVAKGLVVRLLFLTPEEQKDVCESIRHHVAGNPAPSTGISI